MAIAPQIVHTCNHEIETYKKGFDMIKMQRKDKGNIDTLSSRIVIRDVNSVYRTIDAETSLIKKYHEGIDFRKAGANHIEWIPSGESPNSEEEYILECSYTLSDVEKYEGEDCPRCYGDGWYVDFMPDDEREITDISGMNKIVQDYIKLVFTYREGGRDYGTKLIDYAGTAMTDPGQVMSSIASILLGAASSYKTIQANSMMDGNDLNDGELLEKVIINEMEYDETNGGIYIYATLYNLEGTKRNLGLGI